MALSFHHLFFPHESNNHKAKALHLSSLFVYLAIFISLQFSFNVLQKTNPSVLGIASDISIERLLLLTNKKREEYGQSPLKINQELSLAATQKAKDMFTNDYWAHNSPQGKTPWDFIIATHYKYIYAGENLAKDFANSDGVVDAWMKSPSHRENMLQGRYEDIGFAVVNGNLNGEETTLVVQMFGKKDTASSGVVSDASSVSDSSTEDVKAAVSDKNVVSLPHITSPSFDVFQITKILSLYLGLFLFLLVSLDAMYLGRKKIVRLAGHNISHLIFLIALIAVIIFTGKGVIV